MPFITEEIWQAIPNDCETIMMAKFPAYDESLNFADDEREFGRIMAAVKAIRNVRAEKNVPPSRKAHLFIDTDFTDTFEKGASFFERLASASDVTVGKNLKVENAAMAVTDSAKIYLPMGDLIDREAELKRLRKDLENCEKEIKSTEGKLANKEFVSKAPEKVVNVEREKLARANERLLKIRESIRELG